MNGLLNALTYEDGKGRAIGSGYVVMHMVHQQQRLASASVCERHPAWKTAIGAGGYSASAVTLQLDVAHSPKRGELCRIEPSDSVSPGSGLLKHHPHTGPHTPARPAACAQCR